MKKYYGKEKCKILKEIRAEIERSNEIEWVVSECKHQGDCRGTCPKCEAEVRELEAALARRQALGKTVAVVGISAGIALSVGGCENPFQTLGGKPLPTDGVMPETEHVAVLGVVEATTDTETREPLDGEEVLGGEPLPPESETWEELGGVDLPGEVPEETEDETADESDTDTDTDEETWDGVLMGAPMLDEGEMP